MTTREVGWARSGDLSIAYEVIGDGPDVVQVPGLLNTLLAPKVHRPLRELDEELARFARLIKLDKRGTGLSDRLPPGVVPPIEERIDDVRAVMDAVGSERACVIGTADGGPLAVMFAATYPERVASLVLDSTTPRFAWAPDWPTGYDEERQRTTIELILAGWGSGMFAELIGSPDVAEFADLERLAGTPAAAAAAIAVMWEVDVRDALSSVTAPTIVMYQKNHPIWPEQGCAYLAEHIPGARLVEARGAAGTIVLLRPMLAELEELVTGSQPEFEIDRVLKTILFTDIVGSTELASRLGDRRWRQLLDEHDRTIRDALGRYRGDEINTTGDGFVAAFDGPARAIRCAHDIAQSAAHIDLEVRAGVHTGECERRGDDLAGIAVHIGARVAALAVGQEILVTGTVRDLVAGSGIEFEDRGRHELKGVPGEWQVLAVSALG